MVRQIATPCMCAREPFMVLPGFGRDFIMSFTRWQVMNRWLTVPEALHVLWHDETMRVRSDERQKPGSMSWLRRSWTKCACESSKAILG